MAKTAGVAFPTWTAIEDSVQISSPDRMVLYLDNADPKMETVTDGASWSVVFICSIDVLDNSSVFRLVDVLDSPGRHYILDLQLATAGTLEARKYDATDSVFSIAQYDPYPEPRIEVGDNLHIAWVETRADDSEGITGSIALYINGQLVDSNSGYAENDIFHSYAGNTPVYMECTSQMKIGATRLYDRALTEAQVLEDYNRATYTATTGIASIDEFTLSGFHEQELNNRFTSSNSAEMLTTTTGRFKLLNPNFYTSFPTDPITGLSLGGYGTWGSYCSFSTDNYATWYPIIAAPSAVIAGTAGEGFVTCELATAPAFTVNPQDTARIDGLIPPAHLRDFYWYFNGAKTITAVPDSTRFTFRADLIGGLGLGISDVEADINLDYPSAFGPIVEIPGTELEPSTVFEGGLDGREYVVRARGISKEDKISPWIQESMQVIADTSAPKAAYTTVTAKQDGILVDVDLDKNLSGNVDTTFHEEKNLGYIEVVTAGADTDRYSGAEDPGPDTADRKTIKVPMPADTTGTRAFQQSVVVPEFQDKYVWTRVVTASGVPSAWFPNDNGTASERDRFAGSPALRGLGPTRPNNGNTNNLLPSGSGSSTTVDTSTADPEGPGNISGTGGFFTN